MTAQPLPARFEQSFGATPQIVVRSPGRVNLIGEHTDYNDGWALPVALDLGTDIAARRRDDQVLRIVAPRLDAVDESRVDELRPRQGPEWSRYIRGVAALLRDTGREVAGADLMIDGDLPIGAGLSSSASLELGTMVAFAALTDHTIDAAALARLGQRVENEIIGVQSGIMDQLAIAYGVAGHALLIDCRSLDTEPIPIPDSVRILVLDSAVPRTLAGSAYNDRRAECESALHMLQTHDPGLRALRDVTVDTLAEQQRHLPDRLLRRARHVVSENRRVLDAVSALRHTDLRRFGHLLTESHTSLRDDYEVSIPELDALVDIALHTPGVLGARLTGAGFGGCAVAVVTADAAEGAHTEITERYSGATGRAGRAFISSASDGPSVRWRSDGAPHQPTTRTLANRVPRSRPSRENRSI